MPKISFVPYTDRDRQLIWKYLNVTHESVRDDINKLRDWLQHQPHLPEILCDNQIERFLLLNKASVERTKSKIDMYYTIRGLLPEIYENINPRLAHMQDMMDVGYCMPLPQLTDQLYRVTINKLHDHNPERFDPYLFFAQNLNVLEIRVHEDYMIGDIVVYDFKGVSLNHIAKITPSLARIMAMVAEKVYSNGMKELHFINCPTFFNSLMVIIKSVLKPKIADRIQIHQDIDSLYKSIPKKILPKDYGGEERSLKELSYNLRKKFVEYQDRFDKLDEMRVNENLRPLKLENDELYGFYGNFKKLNVD